MKEKQILRKNIKRTGKNNPNYNPKYETLPTGLIFSCNYYIRTCQQCDSIILNKDRVESFVSFENNKLCGCCARKKVISQSGIWNKDKPTGKRSIDFCEKMSSARNKFNKLKLENLLNLYDITYETYLELKNKKILYYNDVWAETRKHIRYLSNFDLYNQKTGMYHIDHIYPVIEGYKNKIPAVLIGNIDNLQILYYKDNILKSSKILEVPKRIETFLKENNVPKHIL